MKNPSTIRVSTPDDTFTVENVATWWRQGADLIVESTDGAETFYPLGEIIE